MDERNREKIRLNRDAIVNGLEDVKDILLYLSRIVFTQQECDKIYRENTSERRINRMLQILMNKGGTAYEHFCIALNEQNPRLLRQLNEAGEAKPPAQPEQNCEDQRIFCNAIARELLAKDLVDVEGVLQYMLMEGVLTFRDTERVRGGESAGEKVATLLDLLPDRGEQSYKHLHSAVKKCQPKLLAKINSLLLNKINEDTYL